MAGATLVPYVGKGAGHSHGLALLKALQEELEELLFSETVDFDKAFHSNDKVQGYTHDFYKYPARFSPSFVRFMLDSFTEPGDYVLDPFMGGGTTIVEAAVSGRRAIGSDLNELAQFVTRVKTTPLSDQDIVAIRRWVCDVRDVVAKIDLAAQPLDVPVRNMPLSTYPFFAVATELAKHLRFPRRRQFARCVLVRVGQWALDVRSTIPETEVISEELETRAERMLDGLSEFVTAAKTGGIYKNKITSTRNLLPFSASDSALVKSLQRRDIRPKLVLTSPPYPGVHVLYHRWQVFGRKETPAPYWIADIRDGHSDSYYTMGGRSQQGLRNYFIYLSGAFNNLRKIIASDAMVIQLISFSDADVQLPLYLNAMDAAGFQEAKLGAINSRQTRVVPNRKWYNQRRACNDAGREVLLIHRPVGQRTS